MLYRTTTRVIDQETLAVNWANLSKAQDKGCEWSEKKNTLNVNDIFFFFSFFVPGVNWLTKRTSLSHFLLRVGTKRRGQHTVKLIYSLTFFFSVSITVTKIFVWKTITPERNIA